jgi:urease accessory protein UreF
MKPKEKSAPATFGAEFARSEAVNLMGDFRALLRQVGSPGAGPMPADALWLASIATPLALGGFLENYLTGLLQPCELPAIVTACGHAQRGELRELLAQDRHLAERLLATPFAAASERIGGHQLVELRPLRDSRIVQRYLTAVESGQAHGWHTLVYGVTLAVFSLPLRQGLLYYAQETLSVLASAAGRSKNIGPSELDEILSGPLARLPQIVGAALAAQDQKQPVSAL